MKHLTIYILFALSATLILLNRYTPLYINNAILHFCVLFIAGATFIITIGHFFGKLKTDKSILITFVVVASLCFLKAFITWGGDWKTQTVLYTDINNDHMTIEHQMQGNRFAFGYRDRIVNRLKIIPLIDWTTDIDTMRLESGKWKKTDNYVNEMNLDIEM